MSLPRTGQHHHKTCVVCGVEYVRQRGESTKRCPSCQQEYLSRSKGSGLQIGAGSRPMGHRSRGVHKGVR